MEVYARTERNAELKKYATFLLVEREKQNWWQPSVTQCNLSV